MSQRSLQLDGLRALAVMSVMTAHWVNPYPFGLPAGSLGVTLFFVLSGYLITGNLLESADSTHTRWAVLGNFYVRRCLRIFPLYLAAILGAALIGIPPFRETLGTTLPYLTNFHLFLMGDWHGYISHLWSLAVEQHFYLAWPWIVLFLPTRYLPWVTLGLIILAPVFRIAVSTALPAVHPHFIHILTPACFDALGLGSLAAILRFGPARARSPHRFFSGALWVGLASFLVFWGLRAASIEKDQMELLYTTSLGLVFVWLVDRAAGGFKGRIRSFLAHPWLVYVGTISYGLYVFHYIAPWVVHPLLSRLGLGPESIQSVIASALAYPALLTALTMLAASISWHGLERPLNALKRHFPLPRANTQSVAALNPNPHSASS